MNKYFTISIFALSFVFFGMGGLWLGSQYGERRGAIEVVCDGEDSFFRTGAGNYPVSLARFNLDLRVGGLSSIRMSIEQFDPRSELIGNVSQYYSAFDASRSGDNVLIEVRYSSIPHEEGVAKSFVKDLGLFAFDPGAKINYRLRRISQARYFIESSADLFMICTRLPTE